jgi:hypothetical protein
MTKQQGLEKYKSGNVKPNIVNFSSNWNKKLHNTFFTTIRKASTHAYYSQRIQEVFDVHLNKELKCRARLLSAELMRLEDITPELLVLDTGTTDWKELFKRFHVVDNCTLLLFVRIE